MTEAPDGHFQALTAVLRSILGDCARSGVAAARAPGAIAALDGFSPTPLILIVADSRQARQAAAEWIGGPDLAAGLAHNDDWTGGLAPAKAGSGLPPGTEVLAAGLPACGLQLNGAIGGRYGLRPVVAVLASGAGRSWPDEVLAALDQADILVEANLGRPIPLGAAAPRNPLRFQVELPARPDQSGRLLAAGDLLEQAGRLGGLLRTAARVRTLVVDGVTALDDRIRVLKIDQQPAGPIGGGVVHAYQMEVVAAVKRLAAFSGAGRLWAERPTGELAQGIERFMAALPPQDVLETRVGHAQELTLTSAADARLRQMTEALIHTAFSRNLDEFVGELQSQQATLQTRWTQKLNVSLSNTARAKALGAVAGWLPTAPPSSAYAQPSLFSGMVGARSGAGLLTLVLSYLATRLNLPPSLVAVLAPAAIIVALALVLAPMPSLLRARRAARDKALARLAALSVPQYCEAAGRAWMREVQPLMEDAIADFRLAADAGAKAVQLREEAHGGRRREALSRELQSQLKTATAWRRVASDVQKRLIDVVTRANRELDRRREGLVAAWGG